MLGHGGDVLTNDWHPSKCLFASGSQDKKVILWDPRTGDRISSLLGHTQPVTKVRWAPDDYWLLTSSKDSTIKLFDIRKMDELYTFTGHRKEVLTVAWHPVHHRLFASGGTDGQISYWIVGEGEVETKDGDASRQFSKAVSTVYKSHGEMRNPNPVYELAWHPLGHTIASASWECKLWTHNKPGATEEVKGINVAGYTQQETTPQEGQQTGGRWNVYVPEPRKTEPAYSAAAYTKTEPVPEEEESSVQKRPLEDAEYSSGDVKRPAYSASDNTPPADSAPAVCFTFLINFLISSFVRFNFQ